MARPCSPAPTWAALLLVSVVVLGMGAAVSGCAPSTPPTLFRCECLCRICGLTDGQGSCAIDEIHVFDENVICADPDGASSACDGACRTDVEQRPEHDYHECAASRDLVPEDQLTEPGGLTCGPVIAANPGELQRECSVPGGCGEGCVLQAEPARIIFEDIVVSNVARASLTLRNIGTCAALTVWTRYQADDGLAPAVTSLPSTLTGVSIGPGEAASLDVVFAPNDDSPRAGRLVVTTPTLDGLQHTDVPVDAQAVPR